jgi:hypothetical protein
MHDMERHLYGPLTPQAPLHIETMALTERGMTLDVAITLAGPLPDRTQPSTRP